MGLNQEQREIVEEVKDDTNIETRSWSKYNGDVVCGIIKNHIIDNHLPSNKSIVGPHVFIEGVPNELDLIMINKDAKPKEFINCFNIEDVYVIIEIKKSGTDYGKKGNKHPLEKTRNIFDEIKKIKQEIILCCLSIQDTIPVYDTSIKYYDESKEALKPYEYFALSNCPNYKSHRRLEKEWQNFLKHLKLI